jgi:hypothetical protein
MTRTNPSKTKPRMDKTTDRKEADRKQIIFTEGAKGGGGKTTLLSSLADFFLAESIPVKLIDADIDNKSRGSLSHLFKGTPKIDIRTDHGLDQFIGMVLDDNAQTVLADLGTGSSKETWAWFEQMKSLLASSFRVLLVDVRLVPVPSPRLLSRLHGWAYTPVIQEIFGTESGDLRLPAQPGVSRTPFAGQSAVCPGGPAQWKRECYHGRESLG